MKTRDELGRIVRDAWVAWARQQPDIAEHPSWLVPYDDLPFRDREVDRQIGEAVATAVRPDMEEIRCAVTRCLAGQHERAWLALAAACRCMPGPCCGCDYDTWLKRGVISALREDGVFVAPLVGTGEAVRLRDDGDGATPAWTVVVVSDGRALYGKPSPDLDRAYRTLLRLAGARAVELAVMERTGKGETGE